MKSVDQKEILDRPENLERVNQPMLAESKMAVAS